MKQLLLLVFLTIVCGSLSHAKCSEPIVIEKELMITDLSVVNDARAIYPSGAWTFGRLMTELSPPGVHPSLFVKYWLEQWASVNAINGFSVQPRLNVNFLISLWPKNLDGTLNLDLAPFRLLAVVNRIDNQGVFTPGGAGEGRFVFGMVDGYGSPVPFTVIFEYLLPKTNSLSQKDWARMWHRLGNLPFGEDFNHELEKITNRFSIHGAYPGRINDSALNQIRTNEIVLSPSWEMREFNLNKGGWLIQSPTKQSPADIFNDDRPSGRLQELLNWISDHAQELDRGTAIIPNDMLGGAASSPMSWAEPLKNSTPDLARARTKFASLTCNGCHSIETRTNFLQVSPRFYFEKARLSPFVIGELEKRSKKLSDILCQNNFQPPVQVH